MSDLFDRPFEDEKETAPPPPARRRVFTVTELTVRVRDLLESEFLEIWVEGEVSNYRVWNNGHAYFTLKDAASQLRGIIFRSTLRYLKFKPADGLRVVARGRLTVYESKGEYQLMCEHLEPQGLGALQLAFDQLKKRLQGEGLFDTSRKRPLPALPRRIGVVTSLDGAVIKDILTILQRRHAGAHLVIRPARVQGEGAAEDIALALTAIARVPKVDVVIVGRGGGSIEDLWAFNEERVARAIARCPVPVISAVGHETDFTIADFVADVRAPTPSAAAEIVVTAKAEFVERIDRLASRVGSAARVAVTARERRLNRLRQILDGFDLGRRLAIIRTRLVAGDGLLVGAMTKRRLRAGAQFRVVAGQLDALSPLAVLGRGYAVCWTGDRTRVVRAASEVRPGDQVRVTLSRGEIEAKVSRTE